MDQLFRVISVPERDRLKTGRVELVGPKSESDGGDVRVLLPLCDCVTV